MATDGTRRIMEIVPEKLHQRVPLVIGSETDVVEYLEFVSGRRQPESASPNRP